MNIEDKSKILGQWFYSDYQVLNLNADGSGQMQEMDFFAGLQSRNITWNLIDNHVVISDIEKEYMVLDYDQSADTLLDITDASKQALVYRREKRIDLTEFDMLSAIMGLVVADALGVPVEFMNRATLKANPVVNMRSYGTHNQPAGTWSDDSSMTLATLDWYSVADIFNPDYDELMQRFCEWGRQGKFTAHDETFDMGIATSNAILSYECGTKATLCGGSEEHDNGNGSLMRILPASLMEYNRFEYESEIYIRKIFDISAITHAHIRSKLGCLIYSYILIYILNSKDIEKSEIIRQAVSKVQSVISRSNLEIPDSEFHIYDRVWNCDKLITATEDEIKSSGYVVDTLEAAIWCFANTNNYKDCVLKAVNLGSDTDTVGAVSGGLAGLYYGIGDIPEEWLNVIARKEWIEELVEDLVY